MKKFLAILLAACSFSILLAACGQESVRNMDEVVARGSFIAKMSAEDMDAVGRDALLFHTYDEFCESALSDVVLYSSSHKDDDGRSVSDDYKLKNERYNADYFEGSDLLVAFFEAASDMNFKIIKNVTFNGSACKIEALGIRSSWVNAVGSSEKSTYACFVEVSDELPAEINAEVSFEAVECRCALNYYTDEHFNFLKLEGDEKVSAYLLPDIVAFDKYIADNGNLKETATTATLRMLCNEEFFEEFALLYLQVPGKFRGNAFFSEGKVTCYRLESDHYKTESEVQSDRDSLSYTTIILLPVPKDFESGSLSFVFHCCTEWEGEATAMQTTEVNLTRTEDNEPYSAYNQEN